MIVCLVAVVDSWGKPPEGLLSGHVNAYGDFDECINIDVDRLEILNTVYPQASRNFEGRYCTVYMADYGTAMATTKKPIPVVPRSLMGKGEQASIQPRKAYSLEEFLVQFLLPGWIRNGQKLSYGDFKCMSKCFFFAGKFETSGGRHYHSFHGRLLAKLL